MAKNDLIGSETLWFGRHSADDDTLVLDPERSTPGSANVAFFSLTQLRVRSFPRRIVERQIREISDPAQREAAAGRYRDAQTLKEEQEKQKADTAGEVAARQRQNIIETHRIYVESLDLPYKGVQPSGETPGTTPSKRHRTSCQRCGIPLDDFVGARCVACGSMLCSCGACGCRARQAAS